MTTGSHDGASNEIIPTLFRPSQSHLFLCLPPEMREHIYARMDPKDCRALRQVCALFKWDVEQVIGVRALIKPGPRANHNSRDEMLQWLQSVIVRSLELRYVGGTMDYAGIQLKNPFMLRELVLKFGKEEFGNPVKAQNLTRVLNFCNALSSLHIVVQMSTRSNVHFEAILSETLTCLENKVRLKDFKFSTNAQTSAYGTGYQIMPDPTYATNIRFPSELRTMSVQVPLPSRKKHLDWLALLNAQTQLTKLELNVGLVSWGFFERALLTSARTLREVSVHMAVPATIVRTDEDLRCHIRAFGIAYQSPVEAEEAEDDWDDGPIGGNIFGGGGIWNDPEEHPASFDWDVLSRSRLSTLVVRSSDLEMHELTIRSHNFSGIQVSSLRKLELSGVHLRIDDLTKIFIQGINLSSIQILTWSLMAERSDRAYCLEQNIRIWILISIALQARPFSEFLLDEESLELNQHHSSIMPIIRAAKRVVRRRNRIQYNGFSIVKLQINH